MYKIKQPRAPCTQSRRGFIKCTFIIVYYDDDMTECTDDDLSYLNSVDRFFCFFLKTAIGKQHQDAKKSIIILIIMIIEVVLLPPQC